MGCLGLTILVLIALPVVFVLVFFNIVTISFGKLGLSPEAAVVLLLAMLVGSMINIPLSRRLIYEQPRPFYSRVLFYRPPRVTRQVIA